MNVVAALRRVWLGRADRHSHREDRRSFALHRVSCGSPRVWGAIHLRVGFRVHASLQHIYGTAAYLVCVYCGSYVEALEDKSDAGCSAQHAAGDNDRTHSAQRGSPGSGAGTSAGAGAGVHSAVAEADAAGDGVEGHPDLGRTMSSSSAMVPPGKQRVSLRSSVASLKDLVLADANAKAKVLPKGGWKLLVRGVLHCFRPIGFLPRQFRRHVTLVDPKQVRMGSVGHASVAAQACKEFIVVAGTDTESKGDLGDAALEVRGTGVTWSRCGCSLLDAGCRWHGHVTTWTAILSEDGESAECGQAH